MSSDPHILYRKADKGAKIFLINTVDYVAEVLSPRQLGDASTYTLLNMSPQAALDILVAEVSDFLDTITTEYG